MVRKAQRLRSVVETMIIVQSINWFQAVKIKIRPIAFALPPITPKKSRNMSLLFWVGIFFYDTREKYRSNSSLSTVCGLTEAAPLGETSER